MASLEQIGALGHAEKQAARDGAERRQSTLQHDAQDGAYRLGFLEGILWERERGDLEALGALRAALEYVDDIRASTGNPGATETARKIRALLKRRGVL